MSKNRQNNDSTIRDYEEIITNTSYIKTLVQTLETTLHQLEINNFPFFIAGSTIFKIIFNKRFHMPEMYGIEDIDIIYFDKKETSYEREDEIIKTVKGNVTNNIANILDIKNQARVHLWFKQKYGKEIKPYHDIKNVFDRMSTSLQKCALEISKNDTILRIYDNHFISDVKSMVIRRNNKSQYDESGFLEKAKKWIDLYPDLKIIKT